MDKLITLLFKVVVTVLAICFGLIIIPITYITNMLYILCQSITGCCFTDLFKCLNDSIKEGVIDTYKNAKEFWSL